MTSRHADKIIHHCELIQDEYPHAKRCLTAMRRSGRDVTFNGYIGYRRLRLLVATPIARLLDFLTKP